MLSELPIRKIIHIDMDAFYASVEQMDNPKLRDLPLAVGGSGERGLLVQQVMKQENLVFVALCQEH